jgi:hypothetical protein
VGEEDDMSRIDDIVTFDSDRPLSTNEKALLEIKEAVFPAIRNAIDDALAARPDLMDLVRRIDDAANDGRGSKGMFRHNFAIWHRLDAARRDDKGEDGLCLEATLDLLGYWGLR